MALVLRSLYDGWNRNFYENQDSRSADYFLMNPPWFPFVLVAGYLYFVLDFGPKFMANREPFNLKKLILVYNVIQVAINLVLFVLALRLLVKIRASLTCQPVDYSTGPDGMMELHLVYSYYLLKVSDLADTVFFVLRKKQSHVSFLHVYHHSGVLLGAYVYARFVPGGHGAMLGIWNTAVHAVMYLYFALTVQWPELTRGAHWKRYITVMQMVQFGYLTVHFGLPIVMGYECGIGKFWLWLPMIQNVFMLVLFGDFYRRTYRVKRATKKVE